VVGGSCNIVLILTQFSMIKALKDAGYITPSSPTSETDVTDTPARQLARSPNGD